MKREPVQIVVQSPTRIQPSDRARLEGKSAFVVRLARVLDPRKFSLIDPIVQGVLIRGIYAGENSLRLVGRKDFGFASEQIAQVNNRSAQACLLAMHHACLPKFVQDQNLSIPRGARLSQSGDLVWTIFKNLRMLCVS